MDEVVIEEVKIPPEDEVEKEYYSRLHEGWVGSYVRLVDIVKEGEYLSFIFNTKYGEKKYVVSKENIRRVFDDRILEMVKNGKKDFVVYIEDHRGGHLVFRFVTN